jgi:hypothetical protein
MVDMEIKTAFRVLVGILMIATVVIATVVMMGGMLKGSVEMKECIPAEYTTTLTFDTGVQCGFTDTGWGPQAVYCNNPRDVCIDPGRNLCCPTSMSDGVKIEVIGNRCCRLEVV